MQGCVFKIWTSIAALLFSCDARNDLRCSCISAESSRRDFISEAFVLSGHLPGGGVDHGEKTHEAIVRSS